MKALKFIINGEEQELVSSVNWQTWDVEIAEGNTKTFFLNSDHDIETAQAAADWLAAWWNPIINYDNVSFILTNAALSDFAPIK